MWYNNQPDGVVYIDNMLYGYKGEMPQGTSIVVNEGTLGILGSAFSNCYGLTSIEIPNSVTSIESNAFYGCISLKSVTIPNSVTRIGNYAFFNCDSLACIEIPNTVISIGELAFCECDSLTSIDIPNSVTSIGYGAFANCYNLINIKLPENITNLGPLFLDGTMWYNNQPDGVVYIGNALYGYKGEMPQGTSIVVNEGTLVIAGGAFGTCSGLASIEIPNSVTKIGDEAFIGCSSLTSISIPNGVTSIGYGVFYGCVGLTSIEIPNSVTSIGEAAFQNCSSLTSVTIGNSVTNIGEYAFSRCSSLKNVYISSETPPAAKYSFFENDYNAITLYVPHGVLAAYKATEEWGKFANIVEFDPTGIEATEEDAPAFEVTSNGIKFTDSEGKAIAVYTIGGTLIESTDSYAGEEITLEKGVYVVKIGNKIIKVKL